MTTTAGDLPLLMNDPPRSTGPEPADDALNAVRELAAGGATRAERSAVLFQQLRKIDAADGSRLLAAVIYLAAANEPAGARLLAAFLDVGTAGERLLPRVSRLSSSRRLRLQILADPRGLTVFQKDWLRRLDALGKHGHKTLGDLAPTGKGKTGEADSSWAGLRRALALVLENVLAGRDLAAHHRRFLADLLELEVDAWQERISRLAGSVDPFHAVWISRLLPILSQADVDVRDLRRLVAWVREGEDQQAFFQQNSRAYEVMEAQELAALRALLHGSDELQILADMFRNQEQTPLPVERLVQALAVLMALGERLRREGWQSEPCHVLSLTRLVMAHLQGEEVAIPLDDHSAAVVAMVLNKNDWDGAAAWPLDGCRLAGGQLMMEFAETAGGEWIDDLPLPEQTHPALAEPALEPEAEAADLDVETEDGEAEEEEAKVDDSAAAIKQMVMNSMQTTSVLLGFLRNQKITSIPGLVATVATRTRNPQILSTIASDRNLYTGFANRDVPLAVLRNPTNLSVKILRRFIHVKFISKIDLKRMAVDRAGMRKEVIREIEKYLQSLS